MKDTKLIVRSYCHRLSKETKRGILKLDII